MADTSARMLRLLSLLQTHRYWPGGELAERLAVSPRTLRRDVDRLRELGYPVQATRGVAGGYQLRAGAALPPLLLDDAEAVAVAVGLRTAAAGAVTGVGETSVRALAKIVQLLPPRLRRQVDAVAAFTTPAPWGGPTLDAGLLTAIALACRAEEELRFDYTDRAGERSRRRVEPHRLVALGGRWYLVAFDLDRDDWRTFRVDRLAEPTATGRRVRPRQPPGGDAAAYVQRAVAGAGIRQQVLVDVAAPAAEVARVVGGWGSVAEVDGGSCRLRMEVDSLAWPAMVLGAVGAPFTIVEPAELTDRVRAMGELFLRSAPSAAPAE
ncbi:putative transcriptional regulator [Frankia torreyi]|uniref:Putative transcriptional regulator n=1 Tax=Frankia torreyi TaxID=1856 RepID=A0A0D8BF32_9ACTN|nr:MULTISPECIES: YafY family protein [Frankia]KJE22731.1 putative transcriptional regulator [Frankia torreyi]KQC35282.1 transcriptional regulator [Frankia sp. ACN1ag]KQM04680.1 putative transcriptional regulator [Frankia sp. CpI1-P]